MHEMAVAMEEMAAIKVMPIADTTIPGRHMPGPCGHAGAAGNQGSAMAVPATEATMAGSKATMAAGKATMAASKATMATSEATMTAGKTTMATTEATMTTAAMTKRHGKRGQQYNC